MAHKIKIRCCPPLPRWAAAAAYPPYPKKFWAPSLQPRPLIPLHRPRAHDIFGFNKPRVKSRRKEELRWQKRQL
nr:MAG TPA: hypothetical protein [Caudoviricetes sp.]